MRLYSTCDPFQATYMYHLNTLMDLDLAHGLTLSFVLFIEGVRNDGKRDTFGIWGINSSISISLLRLDHCCIGF